MAVSNSGQGRGAVTDLDPTSQLAHRPLQLLVLDHLEECLDTVAADAPDKGPVAPDGERHQRLVLAEQSLDLGQRLRPLADHLGVLGKALEQLAVELLNLPIYRRRLGAQRLEIPLLGWQRYRLEHRLVELQPAIDGILTLAHQPGQVVAGSGKTSRHPRNRRSGAGGMSELTGLERLGDERVAAGRIERRGAKGGQHVEQKRVAVLALLAQHTQLAATEPRGTVAIDGGRLARELQRLLVVALGIVEVGQVVEAQGDLGMAGGQCLALDLERFAIEGLGTGIGSAMPVEIAQLDERHRHLRIGRAGTASEG